MASVGSFRGKADLRRHTRKPFHWPAMILAGTKSPRACTVTDVSETGARIKIDKPDDLPEKFVLLLSTTGKARRLCRVIWRSKKDAGVKFVVE
jgi:PilZ domain-containing protein